MRNAAVVLFLLISGCDGCGSRQAPSGPAARWIPPDLPIRGQIRTDAAAEFRGRFRTLIEAILTPEQQTMALSELSLAMGLDPTDREGLSEAGLDPATSVAFGLDPERSLISVPAKDPKKFFDVVTQQLERRFGEKPVAEDGVLRFNRAFGPETVEAAAAARHASVVLVAVGVGSTEWIKKARSLKKGSTDDLKTDAPFRLVAVNTPDDVQRTLDDLSRRGVDPASARRVAEAVERLTVEGTWLDDGGRLSGLLQLSEAMRQELKQMKLSEPFPPAVGQIGAEDAMLVVRAAMSAQRLYELGVPPGGPVQRSIDRAREEGRLKVDPAKLFQDLTGHFGMALGGGDLKEVPFQALVGNPMAHLWLVFAAGKKAGEKLETGKIFEDLRASEQVKAFDVTLAERSGVRLETGDGTHLLTTLDANDAVVMGNEDEVLKRLLTDLGDARPAGPLVSAELRFDQVESVLRTFPGARLPLVFRALWARGLDALEALRLLTVRVDAASMGLKFDAELTLDPAEGGP